MRNEWVWGVCTCAYEMDVGFVGESLKKEQNELPAKMEA